MNWSAIYKQWRSLPDDAFCRWSDLGLHCLPITLLEVFRLKWVIDWLAFQQVLQKKKIIKLARQFMRKYWCKILEHPLPFHSLHHLQCKLLSWIYIGTPLPFHVLHYLPIKAFVLVQDIRCFFQPKYLDNSYFCARNIRWGYTLQTPCGGTSNEYPQVVFM